VIELVILLAWEGGALALRGAAFAALGILTAIDRLGRL